MKKIVETYYSFSKSETRQVAELVKSCLFVYFDNVLKTEEEHKIITLLLKQEKNYSEETISAITMLLDKFKEHVNLKIEQFSHDLYDFSSEKENHIFKSPKIYLKTLVENYQKQLREIEEIRLILITETSSK